MAKKTILILGLIVLFTAGIKKSFAQKVEFTVESGVIPPEFNKNNDTLLLFSNNPFYSASMRKHFRKGGYTGEIKFVSDISKYSVDHCRYVLYEVTGRTTITNIAGINKGISHDMVQTEGFYITDRLTGLNYVNICLPSPKNLNNYPAALEEARKK